MGIGEDTMINPKETPPGSYVADTAGNVRRIKDYTKEGLPILDRNNQIVQPEELLRLYTVYDLRNARCQLNPMVCVHCKSLELWYDQYQGDAKCSVCGRWQTTLQLGKPYRFEYIQHAMAQYPVAPDPFSIEEPQQHLRFGFMHLYFWEEDDPSTAVATFVLQSYMNGTIWTAAYLSGVVLQD
jgi:hypothetical protein